MQVSFGIRKILIVFLVAVSFSIGNSRSYPIPHFKDYVVDSSEVYLGLSPKMQFPQDPKWAASSKQRRKANFAGHYIVCGGYTDCGTGCITVSIVDARNGKVFELPFTISDCCGDHGLGLMNNIPGRDLRIEYKKKSKLLVIRGSRNENDFGTYFYK